MRKVLDCVRKFSRPVWVGYPFSTSTGLAHTKSEIQTYSSLNHSLLDKIYIYRYDKFSCGYLLTDEQSQSIIAVDPGDSAIALNNIELLESKTNFRLTHVLVTHYHLDYDKASMNIFNKKKGVEVVIGDYGSVQAFHTMKVKEIAPFSIGELCVCLLHTPGHTKDHCVFAITHVTDNSTKIPVIFSGDTLQPGICGRAEGDDYKEYLQSLDKLKAFPNETLIFPNEDNTLNNLLFVKTLDPKNEMLNMRIKGAEEAKRKNKIMIPTTLYEEKATNPFLRCREKYFADLTGEKDPVRVFGKLKKAQEIIFKI